MKLPLRCFSNRIERRFAVGSLVGAALIATVGGCSSQAFDEPPCFPPKYSVTPTTAGPGELVTVAAPKADCNPRYGEDARIQVILTDEQGVEVINTTAPMTDAGSFTFAFSIPARTAVGEAAVTAMPHNVDWCDDTGRNNRAEGRAVLQRASCVLPVEQLIITR